MSCRCLTRIKTLYIVHIKFLSTWHCLTTQNAVFQQYYQQLVKHFHFAQHLSCSAVSLLQPMLVSCHLYLSCSTAFQLPTRTWLWHTLVFNSYVNHTISTTSSATASLSAFMNKLTNFINFWASPHSLCIVLMIVWKNVSTCHLSRYHYHFYPHSTAEFSLLVRNYQLLASPTSVLSRNLSETLTDFLTLQENIQKNSVHCYLTYWGAVNVPRYNRFFAYGY